MVATAMGAHKASTRNPLWYVTAVLFSAWVMALLDRLILSILVPALKASLHLSDTQISLLHGPAFSIFYAIAGVPMGRLVDKTNRRNVLALGVAGWGLATMASGLANSFAELFAARLAVGVCQAVLAPASLSIITDCCPLERRGRATSILISGAGVGAAVGSMLGGGVLDYFAAHPLALPVVGHLAAWQPTLMVAGAPALLVALALMTIHEPERQAAEAGPAFKILPYLWRNRTTFVPLYIAFALAYVSSYGSAAWLPSVLMRDLKMAPHVAGLATGIATLVGAAVSAVFGGFLNDRAARRDPNGGRLELIKWLYLLTAVAMLPLLFPSQPLGVLSALFATGCIATISSAVSYTILPELAPSEGRGQAITLFLLIGYLVGLGTAPTLVALITDRVFKNDSSVNLSILAVSIPSLLLAMLFTQIGLPNARRLREALSAGTAA
jgi:MFS family permease